MENDIRESKESTDVSIEDFLKLTLKDRKAMVPSWLVVRVNRMTEDYGMNKKLLRLLVKTRLDFWEQSRQFSEKQRKNAADHFWKVAADLDDRTLEFVNNGVFSVAV